MRFIKFLDFKIPENYLESSGDTLVEFAVNLNGSS